MTILEQHTTLFEMTCAFDLVIGSLIIGLANSIVLLKEGPLFDLFKSLVISDKC